MRYSPFRTKNKHNLLYLRATNTDKWAGTLELNITTHTHTSIVAAKNMSAYTHGEHLVQIRYRQEAS